MIKRKPEKCIGTQRIIQRDQNCTWVGGNHCWCGALSGALSFCFWVLTLPRKAGGCVGSLVLQMVVCLPPLPTQLHAGTNFSLHHYFNTRWFALLIVDCLPRALKQQSSGMVRHPPRSKQMFAFAVSEELWDSWYDSFLFHLLKFLYSYNIQETFFAGISSVQKQLFLSSHMQSLSSG